VTHPFSAATIKRDYDRCGLCNAPTINTPTHSSGSATSDADTKYLKELKSRDSDLKTLSNSELLGLGDAACSDFEGGDSVQETINDAAAAVADNSYGLDDQDMAVILVDATSTLCPTYEPQLQAYSKGGDSSD
jgi:hypothetical protein